MVNAVSPVAAPRPTGPAQTDPVAVAQKIVADYTRGARRDFPEIRRDVNAVKARDAMLDAAVEREVGALLTEVEKGQFAIASYSARAGRGRPHLRGGSAERGGLPRHARGHGGAEALRPAGPHLGDNPATDDVPQIEAGLRDLRASGLTLAQYEAKRAGPPDELLGLSMAPGLAAQLGGGLLIDSAPGRGTTVALWLPISAAAAGDEMPAEAGAPAGIDAGAGRPIGIALLVDDEELVRASTAHMLADLGWEVREAGSAGEALRLVDEGLRPDLLMTDHLMPGMSGSELAQVLRTLRPELPVLVVSGYAEGDGIAPGLPRLMKPFRGGGLAASLAALLPAVEA